MAPSIRSKQLRRKPVPSLSPLVGRATIRNQQEDQERDHHVEEDGSRSKIGGDAEKRSQRQLSAGKRLSEIDILTVPRDVIFVDFHCSKYRRHVNLSGWNTSDASLQLLRNGTFETLTLDDCGRVTARGFKSSIDGRVAANMKAISLQCCQALNTTIIETFPDALIEVNLSYCEWADDHALRTLAKHCHLLTTVAVCHCKRVTDYGIAAFPDSSTKPALTNIDISHCTKITDVGILALLTKALKLKMLVAAGLTMVEGLNMQGLVRANNSLESLDFSSNSRMQYMTMVHLIRVYANVKLTDLNLGYCTQVTDDTLVALGRHCPNLRTLRIASCPMVSDHGVQRLVEFVPGECEDTADFMENESAASRCVQLQTLDLTGCFQLTDVALSSIGQKCSSLQVLLIDGVRRLTALGLRVITEHCVQLHTLSWSGILIRSSMTADGVYPGFFSIPSLDRAALGSLVHAHSLRKLYIGNTKCDIEAVCTLLARIGSQLVDLDVTSIATDPVCQVIGASCVNLQVLRLSRSRYFSEASFLQVARGCSKLRVLELESCEQIRDLAVLTLSENCSLLERLELANDWQITDMSIELLGQRCPQLLTLNVRHCPEVSLRVLQRLGTQNNCVNVSVDGLTPKHANIVRFLRNFNTKKEAAWRITRWLKQRLHDRYYTKNTLEQPLKCIKRRKRYTVRIQRWYRRYYKYKQQRLLIERAKRERDKRIQKGWDSVRDYCVICRQCRSFLRRWLSARRLRILREAERVQFVRDQAAISIQKVIRGFLGRRKAKAAKAAAVLLHRKRVDSATTIQRVMRGYWSRKSMVAHRKKREIAVFSMIVQLQILELASLRIQCTARGFLGRRRSKNRAIYLAKLNILREHSASKIQRSYRAHMARVQLGRYLYRTATKLQKVYRGFCGRQLGQSIVLGRSYAVEPRILILMQHSIFTRAFAIRWKRKRDAGVIIALNIQAFYRGYIGRLRFRIMLAKARQTWYTRDVSARSIQHFFRSLVIVKRLGRFQAHLRLRRRSATKIQATWRMWTAKVHAFSLMLRADRTRRHEALMTLLAFSDRSSQFKYHFLQLGAVYMLTKAYRMSLRDRGWQSPSFVKFLNKSATKIQALVRGHFGRQYASWYRTTLVEAAQVMQRVWRGKLGRKIWRQLVSERKQRLRDQEEEDRVARVSRKLSSQYGLDAYEKDNRNALLLQQWYKTLRNRQIFRLANEQRAKAMELKASEKLSLVMEMSTENVVFQSRVWRDCMEKKEALLALEEDECVAMEKEIAELKVACQSAHVSTAQAAAENNIILMRKNDFVKAKKRMAQASEEVKTRLKPFAVQAKKLTKESARVHAANKQLQDELQRMNKGITNMHRHLDQVLPYEPLLLQADVAYLLSFLELPDRKSSLVADEVASHVSAETEIIWS